jgi:uncharacterized protein
MSADLPWPGFSSAPSRPTGGFRPLREFILKVQSRCNLDCDYCYVYHLADQSWRDQPRGMAPEIVAAIGDRIAEHARAHDLDSVTVRLHGGEPLLAGPDYLVRIVDELRHRLAPTRVVASVQTNGVRLDAVAADRLIAADIGIGISLDGDRKANDLHRRFRNGRSSYDTVVAAIELMREPDRSAYFSGVLCTIQLEADPLDVWRALRDRNLPAVDFLLPHGTWENPPPGLVPGDGRTPYADWLIPIFDEWFDAAECPCGVRMFEDLVHLVLGGTESYESFGLDPVALVVIETDGSYEQVDSMKAVHDGAAATGLHVLRHALDDVLRLPSFVARQRGIDALSPICHSCAHHRICGGGLYPHRYRPENGFGNPSVYCADLFALITHIEQRVADGLARRGTSLAAVRATRRRQQP